MELLIAFVVLTVAFSIMLSGGFQRLSTEWFVISGIGVGTGFLLHELAHKFAAQRFGYTAEFRLSMNGLLLTIISAAIGFLFAAPGAVVISGRAYNPGSPYEPATGNMDDDEYWDKLSSRKVNRPELVISIAGVITNLLLAALFLILYKANFFNDWLLNQAFFFGFYINIVLAAFNMIPFGPLDGAKVLRASPLIWAVIGLPVIFAWLLIITGNAYLFLGPLGI